MSMITRGMNPSSIAKAKSEIYQVCRTGKTITLIKASKKDKGGEVIEDTTQDLKSFPVRYSPFDRKVFQKISWAENVNIILYVSALELENIPLSLAQIKRFEKIEIDKKQFNLTYADYYGPMGDSHLYVVIGGTVQS